MKSVFKYIMILIFLISAIFKLMDYQNTAILISDLLGLTVIMSKMGLSLTIVIELFLLIAILKDWQKKKTVYGFGLFVFCSFIILNVTFIKNNVENCGCMGTLIANDPFFSLIKSVIMLILFVYISSNKEEVQYD